MRVINGFILGAKQAADKRVHEQKKIVLELQRELAQLGCTFLRSDGIFDVVRKIARVETNGYINYCCREASILVSSVASEHSSIHQELFRVLYS